MTSDDPLRHCATCPAGLVCMAGRLKIHWRCASCAKILVELVPEELGKETAKTLLIPCDVDLPVPERESVLPCWCSKCYLDREVRNDQKEYWYECSKCEEAPG